MSDADGAKPPDLPLLWLGARRGHLIDWSTQLWVRGSGTLVDLTREPWLGGPRGEPLRIGSRFFEHLRREDGLVVERDDRGGLVESMTGLLTEPGEVERIHPAVSAFYEQTAVYDLDVWSEWSTIFRPFAAILERVFSRRLEQLNLPASPLDTSLGMTSEILVVRRDGQRLYSGWLRRLVRTGRVLYAGCYSWCVPPRVGRPCVKVVFPLPNGSATVILVPTVTPGGGLRLVSAGDGIGGAGFYFLVHKDREHAWVRFVRTMRETIEVFVDSKGELRADHVLTIWRQPFLRLHYRMRRQSMSG